jgi:hypothetical protein
MIRYTIIALTINVTKIICDLVCTNGRNFLGAVKENLNNNHMAPIVAGSRSISRISYATGANPNTDVDLCRRTGQWETRIVRMKIMLSDIADTTSAINISPF